MELWEIYTLRQQYFWIIKCVNQDINIEIKILKEKYKRNEYPTLKEIQYAIEKYLNITQSEKCWTLKTIKVPNDTKISIFNVTYRRLLKNLECDFRKLVTIEDYLNSIKVRRFPYQQVIIKGCKTIEDAMKTASLAERIENELIESNKEERESFNNHKITYNRRNNRTDPYNTHFREYGLINENINKNFRKFNFNYYNNYNNKLKTNNYYNKINNFTPRQNKMNYYKRNYNIEQNKNFNYFDSDYTNVECGNSNFNGKENYLKSMNNSNCNSCMNVNSINNYYINKENLNSYYYYGNINSSSKGIYKEIINSNYDHNINSKDTCTIEENYNLNSVDENVNVKGESGNKHVNNDNDRIQTKITTYNDNMDKQIIEENIEGNMVINKLSDTILEGNVYNPSHKLIPVEKKNENILLCKEERKIQSVLSGITNIKEKEKHSLNIIQLNFQNSKFKNSKFKLLNFKFQISNFKFQISIKKKKKKKKKLYIIFLCFYFFNKIYIKI
ncbi:hypothetical protein H8356DRAFT_942773 [Neocallimastix lanati (nom. inval.)]|nr:hypothetical protein H8356DRAFT_942773 [Neocallimastix sp. JGI-2020a]